MGGKPRNVRRQPVVAFLRGMNVGGRRITNDDLCAAFAILGYTAEGFLASGNVIFDAGAGQGTSLQTQIANGLSRQLQYQVPTFVRTAAETRAIATCRPFGPDAIEASAGKLQVILLMAAPSSAARAKVMALASDEDQLAFRGRELYWLPCGNMSESSLDIKSIQSAVGVMTIRTHRTIKRIVAKYFDD